MNICITGGSGFIGSQLSQVFVRSGHEVIVLDLAPPREHIQGAAFVRADLLARPVPREVLDCDAIVHLAGVNIFGRWTEEYKKRIAESRTKTAAALIHAVKEAHRGPKVFVSASAIGYYGDHGEHELDEASPAGRDFLAHVCREWEAVAKSSEEAGMRWVSIRTGIVLGPGGGILSRLIPIFKLGLGGPLGSGTQWFSWIHSEDLLRVYCAAVEGSRLTGPVNAVAPAAVRNKDFAQALGRALGRPALLPVPGFALRLVLGELANAALMSQKAVPRKLNEIGFAFLYPTIDKALEKSL